MAEQFAFQKIFRQGRAVDLDEGFVGPGACLVDGPGDQLLAGAGLAQKQGGGPAGRHLVDVVVHILDPFALADDVVLVVAAAQLFLEQQVLLHQNLLLVGDRLVQPQELGDEHGDHGEKANVFLGGDVLVKEPVHGEYAHRPLRQHDRDADKGNLSLGEIGAGAGPVQKERFAVNVRHHEREGALKDAADHPFVGPIDAALFLLFAEAVRGGDGKMLAAFFLQNKGGPLHAQGFVQDLQDFGQGFLDVQGRADELAYLIQGLQLKAFGGVVWFGHALCPPLCDR